MKAKLVLITLLFAVLIVSVTAVVYLSDKSAHSDDIRSDRIVALNEIDKLTDIDAAMAKEKISELEQDMRETDAVEKSSSRLWLLCGVCLTFLAVVFGYIWVIILRPFDKMKDFAGEVAKGNFEVPLKYERSNYFGDFTWAFDSMRKEITKARLNEKEAIENNKTVIATLSHDIKTPIASIRAYAEGFEANLDTTPEKRAKYLAILMRKCDEVTTLTNDLFLHALSDLDKLKINTENFEICSFMKNAISEIAAEQNDVRFTMPDFQALISADKNRMMQITENLINNARKYAKSQMDIWITKGTGEVSLHFRDYGKGIPDEDMPFIFEQFYRGKNCGGEQGSGLGLYIVKYLTEKMNGKVLLHNHPDGLEAVVSLPSI